jgi:hypothetical protein
MSRQLKIDDDMYGGFDDRKDWTADFGIVGNDTSRDEEIARRLQMEEENVLGQRNISNAPGPAHEWKTYEETAKRHHVEAQLMNAENKRREAERKRLEAEQALRNQQEQENIRKINEYNNLAAERAVLRSTYPSVYDRLYNWSLTLLPDYYDYVKRQQLRDALSSLIKRELRMHSSETELEEKIKKLINEGKSKSTSKTRKSTKRKVSKKTRPKSKRKGKK